MGTGQMDGLLRFVSHTMRMLHTQDSCVATLFASRSVGTALSHPKRLSLAGARRIGQPGTILWNVGCKTGARHSPRRGTLLSCLAQLAMRSVDPPLWKLVSGVSAVTLT